MKAIIRKSSWKTLKEQLTRDRTYRTEKLIYSLLFKIKRWLNII